MRQRLGPAITLAAMLTWFAGPAAASAPPAPAGAGISLAVGIGNDLGADACATTTSLDATIGDQVNFCYVVSNHSDTTLAWQTLVDDVNGAVFTAAPIVLAPGATYRYNRITTATASIAPTSTWSAYDVHPDYGVAASTPDPDHVFGDGFDAPLGSPGYAFVEIGATGTNLQLDDDGSAPLTLDFAFTLYGQTSDQIVVGNNGGILFGGAVGFLDPRNLPLPVPRMGAAILPYWTDIYQSVDGGNVYVQTIGAEPNRRFVVEWKNLPIMIGGATDGATFEAILIEGSNRILFEYADTVVDDPARDNGITTTIGIQAGDTQHYAEFSYHEASVGDGMAIEFVPSDPLTYTASQQVTLDVGAPAVSVDPSRIDASVAAGAITSRALAIGNSGNRDLVWTLGQVPARANFPPGPRFAMPMGDPALTSAGPRPRAPQKPAVEGGPHGFGGMVPAFADETSSSTLVSLDAASPGVLTPIGQPNGLQLYAGDFVGEDFSTLYAIDYRSFDLEKVDTATGAVTRVDTAVVPPGAFADAWNGMSWDASTHTMYAVTSSAGRSRDSYLETIDPATAATTFVGRISGVGDPDNGTLIIDIAVDSTGQMYGVDIVTDTLVAIDKTSGEAQTIGSIGFDANFAEDLDFDDYTGVLWFAAYNAGTALGEMYTLDTHTGMGTLVSTIGSDPATQEIDAFAIARLGGSCAYAADVPWLSYDVASGSTPPGATSPVTLTFDASALEAGSYSANICVYSNDPVHPRFAVPVTLTVQ